MVIVPVSFIKILAQSRVSVINRSGLPLENVVIVTEPDRHHCPELPPGQAFTVKVRPSDSQPVDVSFALHGQRYRHRSCGNIGYFLEQRTVVVLPDCDVEVHFHGPRLDPADSCCLREMRL